jgi:hypothetical protein
LIQFNPPSSTGQPGGSTFLDRVLAMIQASLDSLARVVTDDVLVRALIGVTDTPVTHGLGYQPRTWDVVDRDSNAVVWRSGTVNQRASMVIILKASAPVTVQIRFT